MSDEHEIVDVSEAGIDIEETPVDPVLVPKPAGAVPGLLTGRAARRSGEFGPSAKRKGAGWTRTFLKGRHQRNPFPPLNPPTQDEETA